MKLFFAKGACSLIIRIMLNELELTAQYESVDLKTKKTETGCDFYSINPKGAVPVLELNNGEFLTENAVILQYLADTSNAIQLLPAVGDFERYRVLEWLNYISTEVHKSFGPLFNPKVPQTLKEELFIPLLKAKFVYINKQLEKKPYLTGEHFTLPDAYLFVMLTWTTHFNINLDELDHLNDYFSTLKKRESIMKSLTQESK